MTQSNDNKSSNINGVTKISDIQRINKKLLGKKNGLLKPLKDKRSFERSFLDYLLGPIKKKPLRGKIIDYVENLGEKIKKKITPLGNFLRNKLNPENQQQNIIDNYNNKPDFLKTQIIPKDRTRSYRTLDPKILEEINSAGRELLNQTPPPSNRPRPNSKGDKGSIGR